MSDKLMKLLLDLSEDLSVQKAYAADPEAVMNRYGLTDEQKAALRSGDESKILKETGGQASGQRVYKIIIVTNAPKS